MIVTKLLFLYLLPYTLHSLSHLNISAMMTHLQHEEYHVLPNTANITNITPVSNTYHLPHSWRYFLITWSVFVALLSLSGNSLVLVSSVRFNAIKVDKISVVLIRNIAVADLGSTVLVIIPTIGSLVADRWIFGTGMCYLTSYMVWVFSISNNLLIAGLNCSKLFCLIFPLRARLRTHSAGCKIAIALWTITISNLIFNAALQRPCAFESFIDRCNIQTSTPFWARVDLATSIIFAVIPLMIILISTFSLLFFVRSRGRLQSNNIVLILSVSIVYLVSLGPFIVYQTQTQREEGFYAFSVYVYYVSTISNPFLYYWSSASFQEFVREMVGGVKVCFSGFPAETSTGSGDHSVGRMSRTITERLAMSSVVIGDNIGEQCL